MSEFCVLLVTIPAGAAATAAIDPVPSTMLDLVLACKGCAKKKVLTVPDTDVDGVTLSSFVAEPGGDYYLIRFPNVDTASLWFEQNKRRLPGATVMLFNPAT